MNNKIGKITSIKIDNKKNKNKNKYVVDII